MNTESYKGKTFKVIDGDARIRDPDALHQSIMLAGGVPARIPKGSVIAVDKVRVVPAGAKNVNLYVHATAPDSSTAHGWTAAANLQGGFLSETIGTIAPEANASRFGPNAAWSKGAYLGQITLVRVVGTQREIEHIAEATCDRFLAMVTAAHANGVALGINSGFRSYPEQKQLYDGYIRKLPGYNLAAKPGSSNHQNGIAFDFNVGTGGGNSVYGWLQTNATQFGFIRTVRSETWHWEYLPAKAATARSRGVYTTWS